MTFEEIQNILRRKATVFETGGFRPTNQTNESWIGKVYLYRENEEIPIAENGEPMAPLCQLYLPDLPFVPAGLDGTTVLCVFITKDLPEEWEPMGKRWMLREYSSLDDLVIKQITLEDSFIKPFPLKPILVENDFPQWGDIFNMPEPIFRELVKLDQDGFFGRYPDITHSYEVRMPNDMRHKVGGYPSYCQYGVDYGEGFDYMFQIATDNKAKLNIVDGGQFNFAKNTETGEWKLYYDFY